jgi:uncharacterized protein (DUF433 family)
MSTTATLEGMIIQEEGVRGGRPTIRGTGVTVRSVVGYYRLGQVPEEIAHELSISLAGVYAALAYYHLNRDAIEADIVANSEDAVRQDYPTG